MDYEIIATLGPASNQPHLWDRIISAGVTAFRLNTSHLTLEQLGIWLRNIHSFYGSRRLELPIVLDLQGSKWRLGKFSPIELTSDREITLIHTDATENLEELPVPHLDFFAAASSSSKVIMLNDAKVRLEIVHAGPGAIRARVIQGGLLSTGKGITYLSSDYRKEDLNEKDRAILAQAGSLDFVRFAVSYIRDAAEMALYRAQIGSSKYLIAKLERQPALEQANQIGEICDEMWLCRGDLGAELGVKDMASRVYDFSENVSKMNVPVLLAGQVLEHMTKETAPTRSELCCMYDALKKGYRGFVLSDETAVGQYPLESCLAAASFKS